ncbi:MAG: hypothetical protein ACRDVC_01875, partial [Acidimicrobiales bacterium]
ITTRSGRVGVALTLRTAGDPSCGAVTFRLRKGEAARCVLRGSVLSAKSVGTCDVTAVRAARGATPAVSSSVTVVSFARRTAHHKTHAVRGS